MVRVPFWKAVLHDNFESDGFGNNNKHSFDIVLLFGGDRKKREKEISPKLDWKFIA